MGKKVKEPSAEAVDKASLPDYPRGLTFEKVWAALMEDRERMEKYWENARLQSEKERLQREEVYRKMDERAARLDKQMGKLGNRFGETIEYMVMPNLMDKFHELGLVFTKAYRSGVVKDKRIRFITEVDITLENADIVMLVEVKNKPTIEDIKDHIERIEKFRANADLLNENRNFMGAVAGIIIPENVKEFAFKNGFFVVEPSGETFNIFVPEAPYSPREW